VNDPTEPFFHASGSAFDVAALAASAGGLNALSLVISGLPANFPLAVLVVQHLDPRHRSLLSEILGRRTPLHVLQAVEGAPLEAGTIYIAPPDQHLLVSPDSRLSLTRSELVHFVRPSADLLFESVAATYKTRCLAVVLSGSGRDGSMGVQAVKKMGGIVIVQEPDTAEFSGMPTSALEASAVDYILPLDKIATALVDLVQTGEYTR
jgi:two-component system chemotaxis response regulator CheB